jgi:hypothetical protein
MKKVFYLMTSLAVLVSCEDKNEEKVTSDKPAKEQTSKEELYYDDKIAAIDLNEGSYDLSQSLNYSKENGDAENVKLLLKGKNIVRLTREFNEVKTGNYGKNYFYFENGKQFASREVYFDNQLKTPQFIDRTTYYNKKGEAVFTKEKMAEYEIDLENTTALPVKIKHIDISRAWSILNQEKEFETTFQGTVEANGATFLIVGPNDPNGFTSALVIQHYYGDIGAMVKNPKKYVGVPLNVEFQEMKDEKGFTFQILLNAKIKK